MCAAAEALDWDADASELPADLRRESLLHREVKAILAQATFVVLPGWRMTSTGTIATDLACSTRVPLAGARLEQKLGRIIPDVIVELEAGGELLVEVTVTNTITTERLDRIRHVDMPTIEIDFSRMDGMLSGDALRDLVLNEVTGKLWLHRPGFLAESSPIPSPAHVPDVLDFGTKLTAGGAEYKRAVSSAPAELWAWRYRDAVYNLARIDHVIVQEEMLDPGNMRQMAFAAVQTAADALHVHGYPEALDYRLFDDQRTMLHRLMSIMSGHPVAYRYDKVWQVINTMLTDTTAEARSWHSLYLFAIQASGRKLWLTDKQKERLDE